jgi:hypothetical protein
MVASVADYGALGALTVNGYRRTTADSGLPPVVNLKLIVPISILSLATHGVLCLPLGAALSHTVWPEGRVVTFLQPSSTASHCLPSKPTLLLHLWHE